ncbi:MAG: SUMF1/EgtB/PvdO family nonheme iron enzyme [Nitrospirae bacterium]|nr:SUMF1/EgtB/PvdO family nonheme iron enzyme [Nitrospirota bacterium]
MINVSWDDAVSFCEWISKESGARYRLPTESEWEYAARSGGKKERWAGTNDESRLKEYAWYCANSNGRTQPVDTDKKKANGLGLYDMSGNVWEWTSTQSGGHRVMRGGSWFNAPESMGCSRRFKRCLCDLQV